MKFSAFSGVLLAALSGIATGNIIDGVKSILMLDTPRDCLQRELQTFNAEFDAEAYMEMLLGEAGYTPDQVKAAYEAAGNEGFRETPEYEAVMKAIGKHQSEIEQVNYLKTACDAEAAGGQSAVGAGSIVASILKQAMEGPVDEDVLIVKQEDPEQTAVTYCGCHFEFGFLFGGAASFYNTGDQKTCSSLGVFGGGELSIVTTTLQKPTNQTTACMVNFDAGLGPHVGYSNGAFLELFGETVELTEFRFGAGAGGGISSNRCTFYWTGGDEA